MAQRENKKPRRYRAIGEDYNSDDEYHRPRISQINEEGLKYISVEKLAETLKTKGFEIYKVPEDGNCLFHSVADQIYGDCSFHDVVRKLCLDYMEKERNHFSQFVTEEFADYLKRKRQDGVFGNHLELQAISEIYSRPIEIYAVNEEPMNIFQGSYGINNPPIKLSYHFGNHYNSVRDPRRPTLGIGLGLPELERPGMTKEQIKKALLDSEQNMIEKMLLERAKLESDEMDLESRILEQTTKETEQIEIEKQLLTQLQDESEKEFMSQILQKSQLESDPEMAKILEQSKQEVTEKEISQILEQSRKEELNKEEQELKRILEQSRNEYYGTSSNGMVDQWQSALEKAILEQSLYEYYGMKRP